MEKNYFVVRCLISNKRYIVRLIRYIDQKWYFHCNRKFITAKLDNYEIVGKSTEDRWIKGN